MINLHWLYVLAGAVFTGFAIGSARDETNSKRWGNAAFWALLAVSFWFGDFLGDIGNGVLVLLLVAIAGAHLIGRGTKQTTSGEERERSSARYGNKLFLPALVIPFTAFIGTLLFNYTPLKALGLIDPKAVTLVLFGTGVILAMIICHDVRATQEDRGIEPRRHGRELAKRLVDGAGQQCRIDRRTDEQLQCIDVLGDRRPLLRDIGLGLAEDLL